VISTAATGLDTRCRRWLSILRVAGVGGRAISAGTVFPFSAAIASKQALRRIPHLQLSSL